MSIPLKQNKFQRQHLGKRCVFCDSYFSDIFWLILADACWSVSRTVCWSLVHLWLSLRSLCRYFWGSCFELCYAFEAWLRLWSYWLNSSAAINCRWSVKTTTSSSTSLSASHLTSKNTCFNVSNISETCVVYLRTCDKTFTREKTFI